MSTSHPLTRTDLRDHTFTTYLASAPVAGGGRKRLIGTAAMRDGRVSFRVEVGGVTTLETGDWHAAIEAYDAAGQDPFLPEHTEPPSAEPSIH